MDFKLPEKLIEEEESKFIPIFSELWSLTNNGLIGIDLFRCWVEWNILPLSRRDGLMCEYDGKGEDNKSQDDAVETSPPSSGDSAMSALPPMIRVHGAQAKKRKTSDLSSAPKTTEALGTNPSVLELDEDQTEAHNIPVDDIPDVRGDSPLILKEPADKVNPPSPLKATEDPDAVIITGTGYSTPSVAVLSKHTSKESHPSTDQDVSKFKLPQYEKLEFDQLCSGFASRVEMSYEMNKSLIHLMKFKHEESVTQTESALADLRKNLAEQQDARSESERKYHLVLAELERMKADHQKLEKKAKADQAAILKCAQQAEGKLEAAQQELSGLKKHISNMTVAMFGSRAANLPYDCMLKLKAMYTFTEQLYTGRVLTIKAMMGSKEPIKSFKNMLSCLSTLPPQIEELKRSAAGKGVLNTLNRCLAYAPELKPEEIDADYPELKDDGSEFTEEEYHRVIKESRFLVTQLAAGLDLNKYQAAYDEKNKKVTPPSYEITSLAPRRPKKPFNLDMDLSLFLDDEDEFVALSKCNWKLGDLQIEVGESSRQGDLEAA
ncbi:hypothetical protein ZWY2020_043451 [Hordeum vulgare]|nr:hypothetical protein ZWY2020_043451 [Hordeum vulgare]